MTEHYKIWIDQCEAAEGIEDEFGTQQALDDLPRVLLITDEPSSAVWQFGG